MIAYHVSPSVMHATQISHFLVPVSGAHAGQQVLVISPDVSNYSEAVHTAPTCMVSANLIALGLGGSMMPTNPAKTRASGELPYAIAITLQERRVEPAATLHVTSGRQGRAGRTKKLGREHHALG